MMGILQSGLRSDRQGALDPLGDALASHMQGARNLSDGLAGVTAREDLRPLDFAKWSRGSLAQALQSRQLLRQYCELRPFGFACHD
jgi:hypothetical protein